MGKKKKFKTRHTKSDFMDGEDRGTEEGVVERLTASRDGIRLETYIDRPHTIHLQPRHILAIVSMNEDWWDDYWADLHEEQT